MIKQKRCINIDWLEVHCLEPFDAPRTPEFFQLKGWQVNVRPYGTRFYTQMFTLILPDGEKFLEIRRAPTSATSKEEAKYFEPNSVSIRLCNRSCYIKGCAQLLDDFIAQYGFEFRRISRIDIALDFELFDSGDNPQRFVERYLKHRFEKMNQTTIHTVGKDAWESRQWNSLGWGSRNSMITTKLYNKTLEIKEAKDKPYIRQAWASADLVADFIQLTKKNKKGEWYCPQIWRLEFSIQSSVKRWFTYEINEQGDPEKQSVRNLLNCYYTDQQLIDVFSSLVAHYFHFKIYKAGKRKDLMDDKVLFDFKEQQQFYKVEKVATARPEEKSILRLIARLQYYRETHFDQSIRKAIDLLLRALNEERLKKAAVRPYDQNEVGLLRQLIALRVNSRSDNPLEVDMETARQLWEIEKTLWSNNPEVEQFG